MDDIARFEIIAEAASMVSRVNPDVSDDIIAKAVAMVAAKAISVGVPDDEFSADTIAASADHGVMVFSVGERVMTLISLQIDGDDVQNDIDMDTAISALRLSDDQIGTLKEGFSEIFEIDAEAVEFDSETTIGNLVEQIVDALPEDEGDEDACSCGVVGCGGNTPAYKQRQDADIERLGVTLAPVLPSNDSPGFVYSIGMSEQGKTDLLFIGDYTPPTFAYLSMFLGMQIDGEDLPLGLFPADDERNGFGVPIWVVPADEKLNTHALGAVTRLERIGSDKPARLAQIIMPDKSNRFPWEEGYDWIDQQAKNPSTVH